MEFRTKSGVTTTRYLLAGNNWNTEAQTDESGNITRTYLVDPFGTFKVYTGAGVDGKWFTTDDVVGDPATLEGERVLQGLPWYGSTGLYHLRNRWYSPTLQRFLSMDPLGFDAGDANLYRFEGNDPLGNLDPMGAAVSVRDGGIAIAEGYFTGLLFRFLAARAPNFVASTGPLGVAAGVFALAKVLETSAEIYAGKESGTMRKLCPQEIEDRMDMLKLFALGIGGGVGSARGGKFLDRIVPKKNSVNEGAEVLAKEAGAGLAPRGRPSPGMQADEGALYNPSTSADVPRSVSESWHTPPRADLPQNLGGKTNGVLHVDGMEPLAITSGVSGPSQAIRGQGLPGFNGNQLMHVEGHAAAHMRTNGIQSAVLDINKQPCMAGSGGGCNGLLPKMLPPNSTLIVRSPGGSFIYNGLPD